MQAHRLVTVALIGGLVACTAPRTAAKHPPPSPSSPSPIATLASRTGARILLPDARGLELFSLDAGTSTLLVRASVANGDGWNFAHVAGGVIAQGRVAGSGAGAIEVNSWFIPHGASPRARRLGLSTDAFPDPSAGIWLIDFRNNDAGFGTGPMTLVDTRGRVLRRTTSTTNQRVLAALGDGLFLTEMAGPSHMRLRIYDSIHHRFVRDMTPTTADPQFVRMESDEVVWVDSSCVQFCEEHLVNVRNGAQRDRPSRGVVSPDGAHAANEIGDVDHRSIAIDGRPLPASDEVSFSGLEWTPDSDFLFFIRPDAKHFGVWKAGSAAAQVVPLRFTYVEEWTIFDQQ